MIGVDDTCKVCGISCTRQQEDLARCQIDNAIKQFQPHVLPNMYMVEFIPVKLSPHDQIELDSTDSLLKVLEVSVNKQRIYCKSKELSVLGLTEVSVTITDKFLVIFCQDFIRFFTDFFFYSV